MLSVVINKNIHIAPHINNMNEIGNLVLYMYAVAGNKNVTAINRVNTRKGISDKWTHHFVYSTCYKNICWNIDNPQER